MKGRKVNINKEDYPLDVVFIADEEGGYLAEGLDKETKYRPILTRKTFINSPMHLKIIPPLTYRLHAGEFSGSTLDAEAKIGRHDTLSFFGTKREIENIYVQIFPTDKKMQLAFRGDLSQERDEDDYFIGDNEEYLSISMAIAHGQFKKILRMWEQDSIDEIICGLKKEPINGLYILDSFALDYRYKVLPDKRIVKNYQDMPDHFTDFENGFVA